LENIMTSSDIREIGDEKRQLTDDELDLISGGGDPDAGGQLARRLQRAR
jgi:bacteriocin-like protein